MSNYEKLKDLFKTELDILENEMAILETEGYDSSYLAQRINKLKSFLNFANINSNDIYSLTQINNVIGIPDAQELQNYKK